MEYRRELDGLRALAVIPVILFHAGFETFRGGFVGVDVFFVLSGYLITSNILGELGQDKFSLVSFYERRARRILPALFLVLLACIPAAWFCLLPSDMKDFSKSLVAVPLFASNFLFIHEEGYFALQAELKPLLHTWSLSVEEQYYLIFPVVVMLLWKFERRLIMIALVTLLIVSLALAQTAALKESTTAFYLLPTRGWELLLGAIAAASSSRSNRAALSRSIGEIGGFIGLGLIFFSVFTYCKETPFPGFYALVPTLGAVFIIVCASKNTIVGKFVGNRVFVGVGLLSYSAYLWHQPLFAFARHVNLTEPSRTTFSLLSLLAFVLAYFSWRYVETPCRSRQWLTRQGVFTLSVLFSSGYILLGLYGIEENGFQSRLPLSSLSNISDANLLEEQVRECWQVVENAPTVSSSCILGAHDGPLVFGLLGDSHAGSLLHVLDYESKKLGLQGKNFSYRSCAPLHSAKPVEQNRSDLACYALRRDFFNAATISQSSLPDIVIVSARWPLLIERERFNNGEGGVEVGNPWLWDLQQPHEDYFDAMRKEITDSIQLILKAGKIVILIYPVPEMGWNTSRMLLGHLMFDRRLSEDTASVSYTRVLERNRRATEALDSINGGNNLIRIKPEEMFCNSSVKNRCIAHLNGQALYFDNNHLSNRGAEIVLREAFALLSKRRLQRDM